MGWLTYNVAPIHDKRQLESAKRYILKCGLDNFSNRFRIIHTEFNLILKSLNSREVRIPNGNSDYQETFHQSSNKINVVERVLYPIKISKILEFVLALFLLQ